MEPTHGPELPEQSEKVVTIVKYFERFIAVALLFLLMIVVTLATVELAALLYKDLFVIRGKTLLDVEQTFELFGSFLLVFVGLELLTSLKAFVRKGTVHVEVVLEVALVALAQKVILLSPTSGPLVQLGVAALILALAGALWWVRDARHRHRPPARTSGA
jgi:uncharacterized membrane protein (DUF373 family)